MENTIYEELGKENLEKLVHKFYELVLANEVISPLFDTDMTIVKAKQIAFLTQFFGGPPLYNETYGHPRMKMRHLPHKITEAAAIEWLKCMNAAIRTLDIEEDFKVTLANCFPRLAAHMVNSYPEE
ncbi:MAG: globin [Bacteroidota bacterium]